jgi:hypothetical protein
MCKKLITLITLACFITTLHGCYETSELPIAKVSRDDDPEIIKLVTVDGETLDFTGSRGSHAGIRDSVVIGVLSDGKLSRTPLSNVSRVYVTSVNVGATIAAVIAVPVVLILVIAATKQSCPFIYSYDGSKYQFDGEPYGGAICEGLKRSDWSRLPHLRPVDGKYRVLLTNEMNEIQHTDELRLLVVDHPSGTNVSVDAAGTFYQYAETLSPLGACDAGGHDIMKWVSKTDDLYWTSRLDSKDPARQADARDTLYLTFPKPAGAHTARLVVSGSTTLWGSLMLKRMTEVRGEEVPGWFEQLRSPVVRGLVDAWDKREEAYQLQVRVRTGDGWTCRGYILGGGPFVTETRVVPISLEGVEGESLLVRLTPPSVFWQLNSFAVEYGDLPAPGFTEIGAVAAVADDGTDVMPLLASVDGMYYDAAVSGRRAELTFPAPAERPGYVRTVFAKTTGYYDVRMKASGPPQREFLDRISFEPGFPAWFGLQEYFRFRNGVAESRAGRERRPE